MIRPGILRAVLGACALLGVAGCQLPAPPPPAGGAAAVMPGSHCSAPANDVCAGCDISCAAGQQASCSVGQPTSGEAPVCWNLAKCVCR